MEYIKLDEKGFIMDYQASSREEVPHGFMRVPDNWFGVPGNNINEFTDDLSAFKSLSQRIKDGYVTIPDRWKLDGETPREMTHIERIQAGLEKLPQGMKIVDGVLESMTREEKIESGLLTQNDVYQEEVADLKQYLTDTDWIVTKCLEQGIVISEKYPEEYENRQDVRKRINELEKLLFDC